MEHAAYNGNHYASYRLGKEYLKGESVRRDIRKAMDHIYTSAQAGNPHAQYLLGKLLLQGKVVERDKEEGIQWLTLAAEQGHSYAQCLLERQSASCTLFSVTFMSKDVPMQLKQSSFILLMP